MSRTPSLTKNQRNNLAKRKAMGIALIQRPLRYIKARTSTIVDDIRTESAVGKTARYAANRGDGMTVKQIARTL